MIVLLKHYVGFEMPDSMETYADDEDDVADG